MSRQDEDAGEELEIEAVEEPAAESVPGYLYLPNDLIDEGRRAYVINGLMITGGGMAHNWLPHAYSMDHFLKHGTLPDLDEVRARKPKP